MKLRWKKLILGAVGTLTTVCLVGVALAGSQAGQAPQAARPLTSEQAFKDIRVLKGIPVDEFMNTMGMFSSALGLCCTDCHGKQALGVVSGFAVETERIQTARRMIGMMNLINTNFFKGEQRVSCYTCHHASIGPDLMPDLALQYGTPPDPSLDRIDIVNSSASPQPMFDKYIQALGGAQRLAALTSFTATGTYTGFETGMGPVALTVYAKAPAQRTLILKMPEEDGVRVYDGTNGWIVGPEIAVPLLPLTGGNLFGARLDALVSFPAGIQKEFSQWRTGSAAIDDMPVSIAQGTKTGELPVNFYFDQATGLLKRTVRWNKTAVGPVPVQTDYDDYRVVAGVKVPYKVTVTWTNGEAFIQLNDVKPNVAIEAARFAQPAPAKPRQ